MKTKDWLILPLGVLLAAATSALTGMWTATPHAAERDATTPSATNTDTEGLRALEAELDALRREQDTLREALAHASTGSTGTREQVGGVDDAVARWMRRNAPALAEGTDGATDSAATDPEEVRAIDAAVDRILADDGNTDIEFWMELRKSGRLDGVIASLERIATASPHDPDVQVELAGAYVQKVFDVGPGPLQAEFADRADRAYDRAIELDDGNWRARFGKAISLSNQPSFLGKSGEAMRNFEILVEQQEGRPAESRFAQTYFYLGNLYRENGAPDKALAMWKRGLAIFPDDGQLSTQVANLAKEQR